MYRRIMVCTDGSSHGEAACRYGILLATTLKARLAGLHVLDIRMIEGPALADLSGAIGAGGYYAGLPQFKALMEAKGEAVKKAFLELMASSGLEADFTIEAGHPVHSILEAEKPMDLLILGQRGENEQFGKELIGSVAERVSHRTSRPCLITPGRFAPIRNILAACDGSPIMSKVAQTAAALAHELGAELTVATVADKTSETAAMRIAEDAQRACSASGTAPAMVVMKGHADEALLDHIARDKHDLVIMGAHAHTRVREWFVGCTSRKVMSDSGVPVLLVR